MFVAKIDSTNSALCNMLQEQKLPDGFTLYTYHQTQGRGQRGNQWESEPNKNLLLSTLIKPKELPIEHNFLLSEVVALAVKKTLDQHCCDISIKWPNDIYWKDKKIAGILIENTWMGRFVNTCIAGIGININQTNFLSDAPNPISLKQRKRTQTRGNPKRAEASHQILQRIPSIRSRKLTKSLPRSALPKRRIPPI